MGKIKNAKQGSSAQSDPTMYKFAIKKGEGPYCGSVYTMAVSYILDKKTNKYHLLSYSYSSSRCEWIEFFRKVKQDKNGKIVQTNTFTNMI